MIKDQDGSLSPSLYWSFWYPQCNVSWKIALLQWRWDHWILVQQGRKSVLEAYCFEDSLLGIRPEVCTSQERENEKRNKQSPLKCPELKYVPACLVPQSCLTVCDPHGLLPARLLCLWASPGKDTGVGCHFLLRNWNNCIPNPEMAGFLCMHSSGLLFSRCSFWCQDLLQISLAVTIWGLDI